MRARTQPHSIRQWTLRGFCFVCTAAAPSAPCARVCASAHHALCVCLCLCVYYAHTAGAVRAAAIRLHVRISYPKSANQENLARLLLKAPPPPTDNTNTQRSFGGGSSATNSSRSTVREFAHFLAQLPPTTGQNGGEGEEEEQEEEQERKDWNSKECVARPLQFFFDKHSGGQK
jgi:hypothetical protein